MRELVAYGDGKLLLGLQHTKPCRTQRKVLLEGGIDVALVAGRHARTGLDWVHLFADELVAVTPPTHAIAAHDSVEAEAFADEVYITYSLIQDEGPRSWYCVASGNIDGDPFPDIVAASNPR